VQLRPDDGDLAVWVVGDNAWRDVVADFYPKAAANPAIAAYFTDVDMAALQRHFSAHP
jgi:truncated hemoglobin YjbI